MDIKNHHKVAPEFRGEELRRGLQTFKKGIRELIQTEKQELAECGHDMWKESFGKISWPFSPWWIPMGLVIFLCAVGYAGILILWFIAYPVILMLFLLGIFLWASYMLVGRRLTRDEFRALWSQKFRVRKLDLFHKR